jgi:hypothetical protein
MADNDIDIALADTIAGRHWLHPAVRHHGNPRMEAIRAKYRALHQAGKMMGKIGDKTDKLTKRLDTLDDK